MRIGELASQAGVPARRLRYYEDQGLLSADRAANGYRDYPPGAVARVSQIRRLLEAGLPAALIREILPLLDDQDTILLSRPAPELVSALEQHRDQLSARIECIARNRDAINGYLDALQDGPAAVPSP